MGSLTFDGADPFYYLYSPFRWIKITNNPEDENMKLWMTVLCEKLNVDDERYNAISQIHIVQAKNEGDARCIAMEKFIPLVAPNAFSNGLAEVAVRPF